RLLDLGVERLDAEQAVILLREEGRGTLYPFQAIPQELLKEMPKLLSGPLAESLLQGGTARLLLAETSARGTSVSRNMAALLHAGIRPLRLLYLERGQSRSSFESSDVDLLATLAWITSGILAARPLENPLETSQRAAADTARFPLKPLSADRGTEGLLS